MAECREAAARYEQLSLPARRKSPVLQPPQVACVQMDGGRFQRRERMYVYAAAMAGSSAEEGWRRYRDWAQWLWSGQTGRLLAALRQRQQELGLPEEKEASTPQAQVAASLTYLIGGRRRTKYHLYRQQGLPLTSSLIESTIKQINRRIKGTEKFWSAGADPMLHLVADRLSETDLTTDFWSRRLDRLIHSAEYSHAG